MTSIEWTDKTWNPTRGCSRVSKGCEHCYAEGVARRFAGKGQPYEGLVRLTAEGKPKAQWNGVVRLVPEKLAEPLSWRKPSRVFDEFGRRVFSRNLLPSLFRAQEVLREEVARRAAEKANLVSSILAGTYTPADAEEV